MAKRAKKSTSKTAAKRKDTAKRKAAVKKSMADVKKAQKNLDLKTKKHDAAVTAMFFV